MSFPKYPEYKDSGVEWLGEVPAHWQVKRMRFVATLNPSKSEVRHWPDTAEVSFIPMEAVGEDGSLDLTQTRPLGEVVGGYTYLSEGDVTFAKITPCFENGKGAIMQGLCEGVGFGTTELTVVRPDTSQVTGGYLYRVISSRPFRELGESHMYGAGGQKRVPDDFLRNFELAWPPVPEQASIAAFLAHEIARIDALVAEQQRLIELLKEKRQAVISHAVTKGLDPDVPMKDSGVEWLGEVPEHWEVRKLSSITDKITNGYVGPTRGLFVDDGIPYLQSLHIKNNEIKFTPEYYVTKEWSDAHAKSILKPGDVLVVQTGDIGQVAVVPEGFPEANCHALIVVSAIKKMITGGWLAWVLDSDYGYNSLLSIKTGALHPHLNCGYVKDIYIPVPPLKEQAVIVKYVTEQQGIFLDLISEAESMIGYQKERRSVLISAAVTGKIDVRGWKSGQYPEQPEVLMAAEERATYG
ncbi:restriction endonuclease subunit S [Chromohalobacter salexigens]|uniref:restriction endonuclease subunit S n=1 Tax=Chromohalobacter israelensis TaxID=141390 RepID=UPI0032E8BA01